MALIKTDFNTQKLNVVYQSWKQPFNQIQILNYDPSGPLIINRNIVLPAAVVNGVTNEVYPTAWGYSLNIGEINSSAFEFQPDLLTGTAEYVINYITYK